MTRMSARRRNHAGMMLASLMLIGVAAEKDDSGIRDLFFTVTLTLESDRRITVDINTGPYPADITATSDCSLSGGPDCEAVPT